MSNELKRSIQRAYDAPAPDKKKKADFLRTLPQPKISMPQFIFSQIAYIRKWTLFFSVLLLLPALIGAYQIGENTLWVVSSFVPFLGLLAVSESTRSTKYGMCEFEMTTRFSLKSVMLARMSFLGLMDLIILCVITPLCRIGNDFLLFQTGVYLFVPYLLTVNICLWITRRFHSNGNIYGCMCISILISSANAGLRYINTRIYQSSFIIVWVILSLLLLVGAAYEIYHTIKQTEEYKWNLSLTD